MVKEKFRLTDEEDTMLKSLEDAGFKSQLRERSDLYDQLLKAVSPIQEIDWKEHGLTITQDGYLKNGTRVHVVRERLEKEPVTLNKAIVVSEQFLSSIQEDSRALLNNVSTFISFKS